MYLHNDSAVTVCNDLWGYPRGHCCYIGICVHIRVRMCECAGLSYQPQKKLRTNVSFLNPIASCDVFVASVAAAHEEILFLCL